MSHFNSTDYHGYHWCNHTHFTPGYNNSGNTITTYYTPSGSVSSGSIDGDEGINSNKPILVLRYEGSRAFIQYVTNPGASGHVLYKRAWVNSTSISLSQPSASLSSSIYTLIKNEKTGLYLQVQTTSSGYSLSEASPTGYYEQQWQILRYNSANEGYYYKIYNPAYNLALEVDHKTAVVENQIKVSTLNSPNKAQEFSIKYVTSNTYKLLTRCSGYFMTVEGEGTITQEKQTGASNQNWVFELMDKYWLNSYRNLTESNGKKVFPYYIDTSNSTGIGTLDFTVSQVQTAAENWNNINANIQLVRVYNVSDALIRIQARAITDGLAATSPNTGDLGGSWDYVVIRINTNRSSELTPMTNEQKIKLLCHELGHALKLQHPYGEGAAGRVVYSVMCQGIFSNTDSQNYHKIAKSPTAYDIRTAKTKWGG